MPSIRFHGTSDALQSVFVGAPGEVFVIRPYQDGGGCAFDDLRVGLVAEPFIAGADMMIDRATAELPHASEGFKMSFSAGPFPGSHLYLRWLRHEGDGDVYTCAELDLDGWLCPALLLYFLTPPSELHVMVEPEPVTPEFG